MTLIMLCFLGKRQYTNSLKCSFSSNYDNCCSEVTKEANAENCPDQETYEKEVVAPKARLFFDSVAKEAAYYGIGRDSHESPTNAVARSEGEWVKAFACTTALLLYQYGTTSDIRTRGFVMNGCIQRELPKEYVDDKRDALIAPLIELTDGRTGGGVNYCFTDNCNKQYEPFPTLDKKTSRQVQSYCYTTELYCKTDTDEKGSGTSASTNKYNDDYTGSAEKGFKTSPLLCILFVIFILPFCTV